MVELLGGAGYGAVYAEDKAAARQIVRDAIPKGSGITLGGSMTVESLDLPQTFRSPDYKLFDRYAPGLPRSAVDFYPCCAFIWEARHFSGHFVSFSDGFWYNIDKLCST